MTLDVIFPAQNNFYFDALPDPKRVYWIPDFQENYYPDFFSKFEIYNRIMTQANAAYSKARLVLSSVSVQNDFLRLYPKHCCDIQIISFVSSLYFGRGDILPYQTIKEKFNIVESYFVCSNQFWVHKNHLIIIEAVALLKKEDIAVTVYFTGKEYDYRDPEYTAKLKERVKELALDDNIIFLGFLPRMEQIALMKHAAAVIQPSLFEGWNTTIEDAKFLGKHIIASDINTHNEQLGPDGIYFSPNDPNSLMHLLKFFSVNNFPRMEYSYDVLIGQYENNIISLFLEHNAMEYILKC
jgi:glycosyltransferase involved in cell wall biosynthesis